jgi:hypothetical protein
LIINYKAFFKDLTKCMEMNIEKEPSTKALTNQQKTAYDFIKKTLEKDKKTKNFVAELRRKDKYDNY